MERLSTTTMSNMTKFIVSRMLDFWHNPYDASEAQLKKVAGIDFKQLEEIMQEAYEKMGEPLENPKYYCFYDPDTFTIKIVFPMLNRYSTWIRQLAEAIEKIWTMHSYAKIELCYNDLREARDAWKLLQYDSFITDGYQYSIEIDEI